MTVTNNVQTSNTQPVQQVNKKNNTTGLVVSAVAGGAAGAGIGKLVADTVVASRFEPYADPIKALENEALRAKYLDKFGDLYVDYLKGKKPQVSTRLEHGLAFSETFVNDYNEYRAVRLAELEENFKKGLVDEKTAKAKFIEAFSADKGKELIKEFSQANSFEQKNLLSGEEGYNAILKNKEALSKQSVYFSDIVIPKAEQVAKRCKGTIIGSAVAGTLLAAGACKLYQDNQSKQQDKV